MRIGVDGFNLAMPYGTGVATYGVELAKTLADMGHAVEGVFGLRVPKDVALREVAFFDALQRRVDPKKRVPRWTRRWEYARSFWPARTREVPLTPTVEKSAFRTSMPGFNRLVSSDHLFERAYARFRVTGRFTQLEMPNPPDLMHWTYPVPVTLRGSRNIYTLHDLVPLKLPYTTLDDKTVYGRVVEHCVRSAAQLCTVSESSKRDILERFDIDPVRVTNTYQTVASLPTRTTESADAHAIEGIFGLTQRGYLLYFGALEPKKNVGRLIEAYLSLQSSTPLVIVGARAWQSEQELQLMPGSGADGSAGTFIGHRGQTIIRLDYLPRSLLQQLVRGAKALVFPSLYEGFGLPVLEAMRLGTPVITSNVSSLPEIVADAAVLVDPYDVASLVNAMRRLDEDAGLRATLTERGRQQATRFDAVVYRDRLQLLYDQALRPAP